jgi:hypothetical protein
LNIPDTFSITEEALDICIKHAKELGGLRRACDDRPRDKEQITALDEKCKNLHASEAFPRGVAEAIIGDTDAYLKQLLEGLAMAEDADTGLPFEDSEGQFISSKIKAGFVPITVNNKILSARILGRRRAGYGYQLLVKYKLKSAQQPAWKLVASSKYKGAWEEALGLPNPPQKLEIAKHENFKNIRRSDITLGGVASPERDEYEEYQKEAKTFVLLKLGSKPAEWYSMSSTKKYYGDYIKSLAAQYIELSGQSTPKSPRSWSEVKGIIKAENRSRRDTGKKEIVREERPNGKQAPMQSARAREDYQGWEKNERKARRDYNESGDEGDSTSDTESEDDEGEDEYEEDDL